MNYRFYDAQVFDPIDGAPNRLTAALVSTPGQQWSPFPYPLRRVHDFTERHMGLVRALIGPICHRMRGRVFELVAMVEESRCAQSYSGTEAAYDFLVNELLTPKEHEAYRVQAERFAVIDVFPHRAIHWNSRGYYRLVVLFAAVKGRLDAISEISDEQFDLLFYYRRTVLGAVDLISEYLDQEEAISLDWWLKITHSDDFKTENYRDFSLTRSLYSAPGIQPMD